MDSLTFKYYFAIMLIYVTVNTLKKQIISLFVIGHFALYNIQADQVSMYCWRKNCKADDIKENLVILKKINGKYT